MPNYVPIRAFAEGQGARVDWDPEMREVLVNQQRIKPSYISPEGRAYTTAEALNALLSASAANMPGPDQTQMYDLPVPDHPTGGRQAVQQPQMYEQQPQQYDTGDQYLDTLLHNVQLYQSPLQRYPSETPTFEAKQAEEANRMAAEADKWARALKEAELTGMWQGQPTADTTKTLLSHELGQQRLAQAAARAARTGGGTGTGGGGGSKSGGTLTERNREALADAYDAIDAAIEQGLTEDEIDASIDSQHTDLIRQGIDPKKLKDYLSQKVYAGGVALRKPTPEEIETKRLQERPWWQRAIDYLPGEQYR